MRRLLLILLLFLPALPALAQGNAPAMEPKERCALPDSLRFVDAPLQNLAKALKARGEIRIVVLGTSSSLKHDTGGLARTYVAGLPDALQARFPAKQFAIDNLSMRTQSTAQMQKRIAAEVIPAKPDLLIWQTGNVEAARQTDTNSFAENLTDGLRRLHAAGIDAILIAPQYRARLSPMVDTERFDQMMNWVGDSEGVPVFPRHDMMQFWAENEVFDLQAKNQETQIREAEAMNGCLAQQLAEMIRRAVALPGR